MEENKEIIEEIGTEDYQPTEEDTSQGIQETVVENETETNEGSDSNVEPTSECTDTIVDDVVETETVIIEDVENIIKFTPYEPESTELEPSVSETVVEVPFMEKPLDEYNVTEGILALIFILLVVAFIYHVLED